MPGKQIAVALSNSLFVRLKDIATAANYLAPETGYSKASNLRVLNHGVYPALVELAVGKFNTPRMDQTLITPTVVDPNVDVELSPGEFIVPKGHAVIARFSGGEPGKVVVTCMVEEYP